MVCVIRVPTCASILARTKLCWKTCYSTNCNARLLRNAEFTSIWVKWLSFSVIVSKSIKYRNQLGSMNVKLLLFELIVFKFCSVSNGRSDPSTNTSGGIFAIWLYDRSISISPEAFTKLFLGKFFNAFRDNFSRCNEGMNGHENQWSQDRKFDNFAVDWKSPAGTTHWEKLSLWML